MADRGVDARRAHDKADDREDAIHHHDASDQLQAALVAAALVAAALVAAPVDEDRRGDEDRNI